MKHEIVLELSLIQVIFLYHPLFLLQKGQVYDTLPLITANDKIMNLFKNIQKKHFAQGKPPPTSTWYKKDKI
jgi:hypothetical protein